MTWTQAIEKGSRGGRIESKEKFREAVKAWRDFTGIHEGPTPKWKGPGLYGFVIRNGNRIFFNKLKEAKYA